MICSTFDLAYNRFMLRANTISIIGPSLHFTPCKSTEPLWAGPLAEVYLLNVQQSTSEVQIIPRNRYVILLSVFISRVYIMSIFY